MGKIRFGIIGCEKIGARHAQNIMDADRAEITAVCDIVKEKADKFAKEYSCKATYDIEEFLKEDFNVVNICTPSGMHADMTVKALEAGKNVLCEKPMTLNLEDADRVMNAEKKSGKKFFLVKQNRYNLPIKILKDVVYKKKLGQVTLINCNVIWNRRKDYFKEGWKGTMKLDGGALMTQCSHFLDLMIWIGGKVKTVYAKMANLTHPYVETEDTGFITIVFENGCIGSLQYTTTAYEKSVEGTMTVISEKGNIKVGGEYLNRLEYWNVKDIEEPNLDSNDGKYISSKSNHGRVIENVVDVLLDGKEIATNSSQGRDSIEIMQAAYISAIKGKELKIPLKGDDYDFKLNEQKPFSGNKKSF